VSHRIESKSASDCGTRGWLDNSDNIEGRTNALFPSPPLPPASAGGHGSHAACPGDSGGVTGARQGFTGSEGLDAVRRGKRPQTTSVRVASATAAGIVPLTVVATVSFAVASSARGLRNAIRRIRSVTDPWQELTDLATSIIAGHLRDSIATMTPEQVMTDKDVLVQHMIRVCKIALEGIGLGITSLHIADVDEHRLDGVKDAAKEETEARRADVTIRNLAHERESLLAATRVQVAAERQRSAIGVQQATCDAEAQVAGNSGSDRSGKTMH
jgi:hypothetical protein